MIEVNAISARVKNLIDYYNYKHTEDGYSYNKLSAIADIMYNDHKHIAKDKEVYKRLKENMRDKFIYGCKCVRCNKRV